MGAGLMEPCGVLLCAKPPGVTSHDVVARVRRGLDGRVKVGHAGTLDPFASGLLLVLVGRATRAQRFLMALPKTYRVVARLGWISETGDPEGPLEQTGRVPAELELSTGERLQRPPAYSAVRIGGERLYRRARRGEPIEGAQRPILVHRFELLWREHERAGLEVECSAGTYVRQLVAELGDAYCESLERTRIGDFRLEDADEERLLPLGEALGFLPERALDPDEAVQARNGVPVSADDPGLEGPVRLTCGEELVSIGERRGEHLSPLVVFAQ